jgi:hypothetical protein
MCGTLRRILSTLVFVASLVFLIRVVLGVPHGARERLVRGFNKHVLNPFALWLVAHRPMYYGILHHTGRRSGREYVTPVVAKLTPDGIVIPLPYGPHTDWCRNVLAARGCMLTLDGHDYALMSPEVVTASVAEPLVPPQNAWVWRKFGIESYLMLKLADALGLGVAAPLHEAAWGGGAGICNAAFTERNASEAGDRRTTTA